MAPPPRPRPLRKDAVSSAFTKRIVLSEQLKISSLSPNIRSISWSPTGSMVAHSVVGNVRVWNPERPDVTASTEMRDSSAQGKAHTQAVEKVVFNPRAEGLLATSAGDGLVKLWDVRLPGGATGVISGGIGGKGGVTSKSAEHKIGNHKCLFLTWNPNGTELLAGREDDVVTALDIRKADTALMDISTAATNSSRPDMAPKYEFTATDRTPSKEGWSAESKLQLNQMSFSNSGRELFVPTSQGTVRILSYPDLSVLYTLYGHSSNIYCVQHSPLGNFVAAGGTDSLITLWDTTTWLCSHVLMSQTAAVRDLSFSFDGNYLVAGAGTDGAKDGDKGLHVYHVDTGDVAHTIETQNAVRDVAWHPLRYAIAYSGDPGGLKVVGALN